MKFRSFFVLVLILAVVAGALTLGTSARADHPAKVGPPNRIAVIGDSISQATGTGLLPGLTAPNNSWATGINTTVQSHFTRLQAINPSITRFNASVNGARMTHAAGQAQNVVNQSADYVLFLMGGNDVCTSSVTNMTPTATYRAQFEAAMEVLSSGLPDARIYVISVPDVYLLWELLHTNATARFVWGLASICQSLLAQPTCMTQACIDRRNQVRQRNLEFNQQLEEVCAQYIHCRFDDYGVFNTSYVAADVSTQDYFHPSIQGQRKLAEGTWEIGFDWSDLIPPTTTFETDRAPDGLDNWYNDDVTITLTAEDSSSDVSGTEFYYRLQDENGSTAWIRYDGPFTVSDEGVTDVHFRSVDVNGNIEAAQNEEIKIDKTPPVANIACPPSALLNSAATYTLIASDALSGLDPDPSGEFSLDTSVPGPNPNDVTVTDQAGNETTVSCTYDVLYAFSRVKQPVNSDGSSIFKLRSTVPFKFSLADVDGVNIDDATATIQLAKVWDGVLGIYEEAESTAAATTGNAFRYDEDSQQYMFNLGTRNLEVGTYAVKINISDGSSHIVLISLR